MDAHRRLVAKGEAALQTESPAVIFWPQGPEAADSGLPNDARVIGMEGQSEFGIEKLLPLEQARSEWLINTVV